MCQKAFERSHVGSLKTKEWWVVSFSWDVFFRVIKKIGTEIVFVCIETHSLSLSLFFPYSSMQHFFYSTVDLFGCTNWARIFKAKYEIKHQKYFRVLKLYLKQCFVYTTSKLFQKNWLSYWDFILKQNWKKWIDFLLFFWDWLELRCYLSKAQRRQGRERGGVGWLMLQKTFGTLTQKGRL